ncbi:MAG: hypothetical protein A2Z88_09970 [Omnitrophica WOR_2 bacterium GWA2_47_8]|nr:MAG: hypothetical protein A2Z88_09970 [Omnitrophica WOR_2 bacterium GWA2_47_8]
MWFADIFIDWFQTMIYIMISLAFFVGILLLVSQEAFNVFNDDLKKEYGVKKRLFPRIEDKWFDFVDFIILKHRFWAAILITVTAFILLLVYKS